MRNWLARFQPTPWLARKLVMLAMLVGVAVSAFCWGRWQNAQATQPGKNSKLDGPYLSTTPASGDYNRRIVAYMYNNVAVTREELGEYLIARFGADRLEFMVNRKIVEAEARKQNIYVSDGDVNVRFERDLKTFGTPMDEKSFVNTILHRFGKTLYEWKEDVIRPKLMMEQMVHPMVKASLKEKDLQEGYEARYGPMVECRMIVLVKNDARTAQLILDEVRKGRNAFLEQARKQEIPNLAQNEGKVPPIHKHFGDFLLEDTAFRLKEGEVSGLLQLKENGSWVILLCEKHLPANASVSFESVRAKMYAEMEEVRLAQKIPEVFAEMHRKPRRKYCSRRRRPSRVPPCPSLRS